MIDPARPMPTKPPRMSLDPRMQAALEQRDYQLVSELGRGGMGTVYLAEHRKLGRRVAIKVLAQDRQTKENSVLRFRREARTFAQIRHPHIAQLYEFEDSGAIQFLALEYVEGTDIERERRRGRSWSVEEVGKMLYSLASALAHTHHKGILHRDIKPGNILIERETGRVVLTDFGLAKGEADESLTATGFAVGTPAYMSPEQISDRFGIEPDGRSDLFSLAVVAYEMLTGEHPFLAGDDISTMRRIVKEKHKPLAPQRPDLPKTLASVLEEMLQKDPKSRIASASAVVERLEPHFGPGSSSPHPRVAAATSPGTSDGASGTREQLEQLLSPGKLYLLIAAVAVVTLLLGVGLGILIVSML